MKKTKIDHYTDKEALEFHNSNKSGKIEIVSSKPMTQREIWHTFTFETCKKTNMDTCSKCWGI